MNKAKELLKEAGYSDGGFSLEITYITGDEIERKSAELYQSELNKLGITLNIRPVTSDMSVETGQNPESDKTSGYGIYVLVSRCPKSVYIPL